MEIGFYNFTDLHDDEFRSQIKERFNKIIDTNGFIEGEYNASFENKFATLQGAKHCLLTANGTDALEIALKVYDIKPGDKVGVPGITFYATAEAVLNVGAEVVHIDVNPETGLICPDSLKRMHEKHNFKVVIPVHIFGLPAPIEEIQKYCDENDIKIIEDAAQAQGAFINGKPVGASNNLVTFSFYPTKNLSAFGDAGCILTQSDQYADTIKQIRNHGRGGDGFGRNSRCDHLQAAVLDLKLEKVDQYNEARKSVAKKFHAAIGDSFKLADEKFFATSSWHLYPVYTSGIEESKKAQSFLKENGIGSRVDCYDIAMADYPALKSFLGENENARKFAGTSLTLPMSPFLTDDEINYIADKLKEFKSGQ